jgi:ribosomal-protein-alanine N-acetyltransferase
MHNAPKQSNDATTVSLDENEWDATYRLLPMTEHHLPAVVAIEKEAFPYPWDKAIFLDCLRVGYQCWVIEYRQQVIAYAIVMVVLDESHLLNIAVAPSWRKHRVATRFLSKLLANLQVQKIRHLYLEVRQTNQSAIHLYENLGFKQVGIRKGYYPTENGKEDAILFTKEMN